MISPIHRHACMCKLCRPRHISERRRFGARTEALILVGAALAAAVLQVLS